MTELKRLFDAQADEFALELLRSAEGDAPSSRSLSQTAAALGIGAAFAGTAVAPSAVASTIVATQAAATASVAAPAAVTGVATLTFAVVAKQAAVGMVAGLVAMGGYYSAVGVEPRAPDARSGSAVASPGEPNPAGKARPVPASAPLGNDVASEAPADPGAGLAAAFAPESAEAAAASPAPEAKPAARTAKIAAIAPKVEALAAPVAAERAPEPPAAKAPAKQGMASELALEVELLDRARAALRGGNALFALTLLEGHRGGILAPEAQFLRIQALEQSGQSRAAGALARDFLARQPGSRHAAALRSLAERTDGAP